MNIEENLITKHNCKDHERLEQSEKAIISCLGPLVLLLPKVLIIWFSNLSIMSLPDEGYARNTPCTLDLISPSFYYMSTFTVLHNYFLLI